MAVKTKACLMRLLLELGVEADLEKCLDAYALQYISEVLSQVQDEDGSFDLECFVSMLAAYIPELESADRSKMMDWTVYAAAELSGQDPPMADGGDTDVTAGMCALQGVSQLEQVCVGGRQQEVLEEDTGKVLPVEQPRQAELSEDERLLQEMFPDVLANEIHDVFVAMDMDMDRTVESLLSDTHQKVRQVEESSCKESVGSSTEMVDKGCAVVDQAVKDSILAKYSYIDTQSDKTTHRPFLPQNSAENKKIRYRDDQVVSTKGERFSVVTKKDLESEDMKKTYINLKPLRHYRFH